MIIKSIQPKTKAQSLRLGISGRLDDMGLTFDLYQDGLGLKLTNVRLQVSKPNTYTYEASDNYKIIKDGKGKLYAQNTRFKDYRVPIRRGKYLQYNDWARLNNALNDICDNLGVSCNITSSTHIIRRGTDRRWRKR